MALHDLSIGKITSSEMDVILKQFEKDINSTMLRPEHDTKGNGMETPIVVSGQMISLADVKYIEEQDKIMDEAWKIESADRQRRYKIIQEEEAKNPRDRTVIMENPFYDPNTCNEYKNRMDISHLSLKMKNNDHEFLSDRFRGKMVMITYGDWKRFDSDDDEIEEYIRKIVKGLYVYYNTIYNDIESSLKGLDMLLLVCGVSL